MHYHMYMYMCGIQIGHHLRLKTNRRLTDTHTCDHAQRNTWELLYHKHITRNCIALYFRGTRSSRISLRLQFRRNHFADQGLHLSRTHSFLGSHSLNPMLHLLARRRDWGQQWFTSWSLVSGSIASGLVLKCHDIKAQPWCDLHVYTCMCVN